MYTLTKTPTIDATPHYVKSVKPGAWRPEMQFAPEIIKPEETLRILEHVDLTAHVTEHLVRFDEEALEGEQVQLLTPAIVFDVLEREVERTADEYEVRFKLFARLYPKTPEFEAFQAWLSGNPSPA